MQSVKLNTLTLYPSFGKDQVLSENLDLQINLHTRILLTSTDPKIDIHWEGRGKVNSVSK